MKSRFAKYRKQLEQNQHESSFKVLLKRAQTSGVLNLCNKELSQIPDEVWCIESYDKNNSKSEKGDSVPDFSKPPSDDNWWDLEPLSKLFLASNKIQVIPSDKLQLIDSLIILDLRDNLIPVLPEEIRFLTNLKSLNLSINRLTAIPQSIKELKNLISLNISSNELKSLSRGIFFSMESLRDLVAKNRLNKPVELFLFPCLKECCLSFNLLTCIPAESINNPDLKSLTLSDNCITQLPTNLDQLVPNLETLNLSNNDLSELPLSIGRMSELRTINLEGNPLRTIPQAVLAQGSLGIKNLLLERSQLNEVQENEIPKLIAELNNNRIIDHKSSFVDLAKCNASGILDWSATSPSRSNKIKWARDGRSDRVVPLPDVNNWREIAVKSSTDSISHVKLCFRKLKTIPLGLYSISATVLQLNLSGCALDSLPHEFASNFHRLQVLHLERNNLENLPTSLNELDQLTELYLDDNNGLGPNLCDSWKEAPFLKAPLIKRLETLSLSGCKLVTCPPAEVLRAPEAPLLSTLILANNDITHLPPEMGLCEQLKSLVLDGNPIRNPRFSNNLEDETFLLAKYVNGLFKDSKSIFESAALCTELLPKLDGEIEELYEEIEASQLVTLEELPKSAREVDLVRQDAQCLQDQLMQMQGDFKAARQATEDKAGSPLAELADLDAQRQRLVKVITGLEEHLKWLSVEEHPDSLFQGDNLLKVCFNNRHNRRPCAKHRKPRLSNLHALFKELFNGSEFYEPRQKLIANLRDSCESKLAPILLQTLSRESDVCSRADEENFEPCRWNSSQIVEFFALIDRLPSAKSYYLSWLQKRLEGFWIEAKALASDLDYSEWVDLSFDEQENTVEFMNPDSDDQLRTLSSFYKLVAREFHLQVASNLFGDESLLFSVQAFAASIGHIATQIEGHIRCSINDVSEVDSPNLMRKLLSLPVQFCLKLEPTFDVKESLDQLESSQLNFLASTFKPFLCYPQLFKTIPVATDASQFPNDLDKCQQKLAVLVKLFETWLKDCLVASQGICLYPTVAQILAYLKSTIVPGLKQMMENVCADLIGNPSPDDVSSGLTTILNSGDNVLADLAYVPQEYMTQIGHFVMSVPEKLEPFLAPERDSILPQGLGACLKFVSESEEMLSGNSAATVWFETAICKWAAEIIVEELIYSMQPKLVPRKITDPKQSIPALTDHGAKQMAKDLLLTVLLGS
ncbi:Leucine-rich repeat-containing protein 40 [Cichlidogyrus casuarinus]|uniref:Leucine-rich repeat-containing protein 40 n=1 Tax=Cichlidogyrus casuarinus TaxID=1844966 RepID=A0ABD2QMH7_9PLAT